MIRNQNELLAQWVTAFGRKLRPEFVIGKYKTLTALKPGILPAQTFWSGEMAAELLNLNLKSQNKTIYTDLPPVEIIKELRLIPDEKGSIELLKTLWNTKELTSDLFNIAPSLIIYADLMLSENSRNIEIAGEFYERFLRNTRK
jgi:hypothetical protein